MLKLTDASAELILSATITVSVTVRVIRTRLNLAAAAAVARSLHYGQFFQTVVLEGRRPPLSAAVPADVLMLMER
jgi:hypothetical protein